MAKHNIIGGRKIFSTSSQKKEDINSGRGKKNNGNNSSIYHGDFSLTLLFMCCVVLSQLQLYPTLCNSIDCSLPGSSVHGILQARILEWVAMPFSMDLSMEDLSNPRIEPMSLAAPALPGGFFTTSISWEAQ